ncbi:MAG: FAD-dependent oxidoreductase [Marinoscillum sp.]
MEKVEYLIVGQGIAGGLLAYELNKTGKSILIINHETSNTSSNKAAGIYNPITGRKMVKTWLADELFVNLESFYANLERALGAKFLYPKPIYRPFYGHEEQNDWAGRSSEPGYTRFIKSIHTKSRGIEGVLDEFGGLELNHSGYVNLPDMLSALKLFFQNKGLYRSGVFQYENLEILEDRVIYQNIEAEKVVFCEGPAVGQNPFWNKLPFKPVKGEILEIDTSLPEDVIVNRGVFILPKNGYFSVGSTYDHQNLNYEPSADGIKNLKERLGKVYNGGYEIVKESAGIRPATYDRKPFIGFHSKYPNIGIFNGFGTKGVSLVPFFATQLVNYLNGDGEIMSGVDVSRVNL